MTLVFPRMVPTVVLPELHGKALPLVLLCELPCRQDAAPGNHHREDLQ